MEFANSGVTEAPSLPGAPVSPFAPRDGLPVSVVPKNQLPLVPIVGVIPSAPGLPLAPSLPGAPLAPVAPLRLASHSD